MKRILFLSFFVFTSTIFGSEATWTEQQFIQQHLAPESIKSVLDQNQKLIFRHCVAAEESGHEFIVCYNALPDFVIKGNPSRVIGAERLKYFSIGKEVQVTDKFFYPLVSNPSCIEHYCCVARRVQKSHKEHTITLSMMKQLCTYAKALYCDFGKSNMFFDEQGILRIIDTESISFRRLLTISNYKDSDPLPVTRSKDLIISFALDQLRRNIISSYRTDQDAQDYLINKIKKYESIQLLANKFSKN